MYTENFSNNPAVDNCSPVEQYHNTTENGTIKYYINVIECASFVEDFQISQYKPESPDEKYLSSLGIIPSIIGVLQSVAVGIFYFKKRNKK